MSTSDQTGSSTRHLRRASTLKGNKVLERAQSVHKITRKIELPIVQEKAIRDAGMRNHFLLLVPQHVYVFGDKQDAGTGKEGSVEDAQETRVARDVEANEQEAGTSKPHVQARNQRTGSAPFMAREVLNTTAKYTHGLHHDLESFLYVAVWHGVGYRGYRLPSNKEDVLARWRKGTWSSMLSAKREPLSDLDVMTTIIGKIQDKGLAFRCESIWETFAKASLDRKYAVLKRIRKARDLGKEEIHQALTQPERAVVVNWWMGV